MSSGHFVRLRDRGIITVAGPDRVAFLQGLVSNDVEKCTSDRSIWAALLTPQGKYLHDFFLTDWEDCFRLDCEARAADGSGPAAAQIQAARGCDP